MSDKLISSPNPFKSFIAIVAVIAAVWLFLAFAKESRERQRQELNRPVPELGLLSPSEKEEALWRNGTKCDYKYQCVDQNNGAGMIYAMKDQQQIFFTKDDGVTSYKGFWIDKGRAVARDESGFDHQLRVTGVER